MPGAEDSSAALPKAVLVKVEQQPRFLRAYFTKQEDGKTTEFYADYHWFWLRHNCTCRPQCCHEITGERLIDSSELLLTAQPISVEKDEDNQVKVHWGPSMIGEPESARHESVYTSSFLVDNAYSINRTTVLPPPSDLSLVELDYRNYTTETHDQYLLEVGKRLKEFGVVVVKNRGLDTEAIISDLLPEGVDVIPTHFGRIEDLRTDNTSNKNTDQLGYTNAGVDLHTDQPFIENPPGLQALQCITPADVGGDNFMVDARHAARYLRQEDPAAFERLVQTNVRFHRKQKNFESLQVTPIIQLDQDGEPAMVRYSYFTYAPHIVPFEFMEEWYKAYNAFASLVRDKKNQYRFLLNSGDFVLYDNHRMFHARTGFSGPRHVRGIYFNHKDVFTKLQQPID